MTTKTTPSNLYMDKTGRIRPMPQTINDSGYQKLMLTLAVGCFAEKLNSSITDVAKAEYQKAFDLASRILDTYWRSS